MVTALVLGLWGKGWGEETVKVFVLAGQSNMEGKAKNSLLEHQASDPRFQDFWKTYRTGNAWTERDDVFITFFRKHGPLTIGYGSGDTTGPELAFGHVLGDHLDEPVLLIKAAWGGHSLYERFRPPSSKLPPEDLLQTLLVKEQQKNPDTTLVHIKERYGSSYRMMMAEVKRVLAEKDTLFPALKGKNAEFAGFFWFQGFNDQFGDQAPDEYETNMKNFIQDVRTDLDAPNLPFVIAGIGTYGWNGATDPKPGSGTEKVLNGQLAMNQVAEFNGTVHAFKTAPFYDKIAAKVFPEWKKRWEEWQTVGSDRPYHYLGSGIWYSRIGHHAGTSMIELLQ